MTDWLLATEIHAGEAVTDKITIEGDGLSFPVEPPEVEMQNVKAQLQDIVDIDTLIQDQLQSSKTFIYQLIFEKSGVFDFNGIIGFRIFNPREKKVEVLQSKSRVTVYNAAKSDEVKLVRTFGSKNNFIAIDASESMQIEDYRVNRLGAVKSGLKQFLMSREDCGIGLILFGGDAKHFAMSDPDKCYTPGFIDSINFTMNRRGTAIGDAIWLAQNSYAKNTLAKKLVIIGDGDNTAGYIPPKLAATLAKKHNITIYTIGVGTHGLVPYGIDDKGRPNMIDNTFTDKDFKIISSITNGKYYWAKDEQDIHRILKIIFQ